jgi:hypothetical protein
VTENSSLTVDIETMRASARRLLAPDAAVPSVQELEALMLMLKGHLALVIPEVGRAASGRRGDDSFTRADARMAISETCRKLRITPSPGLSAHIAYARRLSRSLNALCDHYENLRGEHPEAAQ